MRFTLVDTPAGFRAAADKLAAGRGPLGIDTERASSFRYDDRAFLVQVHRREAGTFLIAPEGHRDAVREIFSPALSGADWILHAAGEDLPSLASLGLHPGRLFDTELAARMAGYPKPNLAAMVHEFTNVTLAKGHGREDWSTTPLPPEWQEYAALDVIYLNDVAEGLTELLDGSNKLSAAEQEFAHLAAQPAPVPKTWRDMKAISTLTSGRELHIARSLWQHRDARSRARDTSPHALLPTKVIIEIAREKPRTPGALARLRGFPARRRGAVDEWFAVLSAAYGAAPEEWPDSASMHRRADEPPGKSAWQRHHPESWSRLSTAREAVATVAAIQSMAPEVVLQPALLRRVMWDGDTAELLDTHMLAQALSAAGARPWQVSLAAPAISAALRDAEVPTS